MKRELKKLDELTGELIMTKKISLYLIGEISRIYDELQMTKKAVFFADGLIPILKSCGFEVNEHGVNFEAAPRGRKYTRKKRA